MFIGKGLVDLVRKGFGIVFLAPTVLELSPFSCWITGRDRYFRVTWQPEVEFDVFIGQSGVDLLGIGFGIVFLAPPVLEILHFYSRKNGRDSNFRVTWQPEVIFNVFIGQSGVDLVGIGFGIVFLAPTFLEIMCFSCPKSGRESYFRVTWQPEVVLNVFIG